MATQQELAAQLRGTKDQLAKIGTETGKLIQKVADLTAVIASGGDVSPELQAAADDVAAQAKVVDDMVPDVAPDSPDAPPATT